MTSENWDGMCDEDGAVITQPGQDPADTPTPDQFWAARRSLAHLHTYARARMVAPWAVLGCALARIAAATTPQAQLPPLIGGHASLNLFVGLVGPSGDGKDAAGKVARNAIDLTDGTPFIEAPIGSGEGLAHLYMRADGNTLVQHNTNALIVIGEIDTLTALKGRQASTVMPQLRQAAMGEQLGFFYVDTTKRMLVPEHQYRMCLIAGIQPKRASTLLDDADGGTPQRFLWLPTTEPDMPDEEPDAPPGLLWEPPDWAGLYGSDLDRLGRLRHTIALPDAVAATIKQAHRDRRRGRGDALDGHALLTREKTAAALAILEGRHYVTEEDWALSGVVMTVSDHTRAACTRALLEEKRRANHGQALAEAHRQTVIADTVTADAVKRVSRTLQRKLTTGPLTRNDLRKELNSRDRQHADDALDHLEHAGIITKTPTDNQGPRGDRYDLV